MVKPGPQPGIKELPRLRSQLDRMETVKEYPPMYQEYFEQLKVTLRKRIDALEGQEANN